MKTLDVAGGIVSREHHGKLLLTRRLMRVPRAWTSGNQE
jgi:hypothetical protein